MNDHARSHIYSRYTTGVPSLISLHGQRESDILICGCALINSITSVIHSSYCLQSSDLQTALVRHDLRATNISHVVLVHFVKHFP